MKEKLKKIGAKLSPRKFKSKRENESDDYAEVTKIKGTEVFVYAISDELFDALSGKLKTEVENSEEALEV